MILDEVHQNVMKERIQTQGSEGVLICDGWKNSAANTKNVVCIVNNIANKDLWITTSGWYL